MHPLNLEYLHKYVHDSEGNVDTSEIYKFTFVDDKAFNINSDFIIRNKRFKCIKIERTITTKGFERIAKGEFYPYTS